MTDARQLRPVVRERLREVQETGPGGGYERGEQRGRVETLEWVLECIDDLEADEEPEGLLDRFFAWLESDDDRGGEGDDRVPFDESADDVAASILGGDSRGDRDG